MALAKAMSASGPRARTMVASAICFVSFWMPAVMLGAMLAAIGPAPPAAAQVDFVWDFNFEVPMESRIDSDFASALIAEVEMSDEVREEAIRVLHEHGQSFAAFKERHASRVAAILHGIASASGVARWDACCRAYQSLKGIADEQRRLDMVALEVLGRVVSVESERGWLCFLSKRYENWHRSFTYMTPDAGIDLVLLAQQAAVIPPCSGCAAPIGHGSEGPGEGTWVTEYLRGVVSSSQEVESASIALSRNQPEHEMARAVVEEGEVRIGWGPKSVHDEEQREWERLVRADRARRDVNRRTIQLLEAIAPNDSVERLWALYIDAILERTSLRADRGGVHVLRWGKALEAFREAALDPAARKALEPMVAEMTRSLQRGALALSDEFGTSQNGTGLGDMSEDEASSRTQAAFEEFVLLVKSKSEQLNGAVHGSMAAPAPQ